MKYFIIIFLCLITSCMLLSQDSFVDPRDGKKYNIIESEDLIWFASNLNYNSKYSRTYNDDEENATIHGRLYNYKEAKHVCPEGWSLPSLAQWNKFVDSFVSEGIFAFMNTDKTHWQVSTLNTNSSGFNALPSGMIKRGKFVDLGISSNFWAKRINFLKPYPHFHIYGMHMNSVQELSIIDNKKNKLTKINQSDSTFSFKERYQEFIYVFDKDIIRKYFSHTPHFHPSWKDRFMSIRCVQKRQKA